MRRLYILSLFALLIALPLSCSKEKGDIDIPDGNGYKLNLNVITKATEEGTGEEIEFRSLYIYAFDVDDGTSDYYHITGIDHVQTRYPVEMEIGSEGEKRFYVIVNPPAYVLSKLTSTITEGGLQSLVISMKGVAYDMSDLPQNIDGISSTNGDTGFPMANVMTAYARVTDATNHIMSLYSQSQGGLLITSLPVVRSLGKISVKAYLYNHTTAVSVTNMSIYRYTGNGAFIPEWQDNGAGGSAVSDWQENTAMGGTAEWNSSKLMDLESMSEMETRLITDEVSVMNSSGDVTVGSTCTGKATAATISSFYLCQNSYGEAINATEQSGVEDTGGNRTTHLSFSLSDGRNAEFTLPYLRRNDHLIIYLRIAVNSIQFEFKVWNSIILTPDWNDD